MGLLVQKYGGSSVSSVAKIMAIASRVASLTKEGHQVIVVVSAMGKTTDDLVSMAQEISLAPNRRELDMLLTTGERITMALLSMALNHLDVPAISFTGSQAGVFTNGAHSQAQIVDIRPIRVAEALKQNRVVVLAGFQGVNPQTKEVTTLGRGGSDTTAVAMAAHFHADRCEILKDVEGVFSADPKIAPHAHVIENLGYQHLMEMTFWGAKVLHYRSVELAKKLNVPLWVGLAHGLGRSTTVSDIEFAPIQTKIDEGNSAMETSYEQTRVLAVNSLNTIYHLHIFTTSQAKALSQLEQFLLRAQLPQPQLLCSEVHSDSTELYITAPEETLSALSHLCLREKWIQVGSKPLASVTLTCFGAIGSDLALRLVSRLNEKRIPVYKLLQSSLSLTLFVEQAHRETAIATAHEFVG